VTPTTETTGTPDEPDLEGLGYADALEELESILADLDRDHVDVDDLAHQVRRAAALIRHCRGRITAARLEVERVVVELNELAGADETGDDAPDGSEPDAADG
jgi:exodeoxyribonuclease VII small subunit